MARIKETKKSSTELSSTIKKSIKYRLICSFFQETLYRIGSFVVNPLTNEKTKRYLRNTYWIFAMDLFFIVHRITALVIGLKDRKQSILVCDFLFGTRVKLALDLLITITLVSMSAQVGTELWFNYKRSVKHLIHNNYRARLETKTIKRLEAVKLVCIYVSPLSCCLSALISVGEIDSLGIFVLWSIGYISICTWLYVEIPRIVLNMMSFGFHSYYFKLKYRVINLKFKHLCSVPTNTNPNQQIIQQLRDLEHMNRDFENHNKYWSKYLLYTYLQILTYEAVLLTIIIWGQMGFLFNVTFGGMLTTSVILI